MSSVLVDLGDLDAVGIAGEVVAAVRRHAIEAAVDTVATVTAPPGWHRVLVTARRSGHVVLAVRYEPLTSSRLHNVARHLEQRDWQLDEDQAGATRRYPPGTEATVVAFELLAAATLAGAPVDTREVTAIDATGVPVPLL